MVKKRESFRPFAPAVLEERLHDYFDLPSSARSLPFMVMVAHVKPAARELLAAVTHVDGTARVQSVSNRHNPKFHALIGAFGRTTGTPVLLNTSFNNNAEPIVDTIDDAVTTLVTSGLHTLVIGDWFVRVRRDEPLNIAISSLIPHVASACKLVRRLEKDGRPWYGIESNVVNFSAPDQPTKISTELFDVLLWDKDVSFRERLIGPHRTQGQSFDEQTKEMLELWRTRRVRLVPKTSER
jgi:hypothetical protein